MITRIIKSNYMNDPLYLKGLEMYKNKQFKIFGWVAFCFRHQFPIF